MASAKLLFTKHSIVNGDMTGSITGQIIDVTEAGCASVHLIWSGTPAGTLAVRASNDGVNFTNLTTQAAGGAAGSLMYNIERVGFVYLQVTYTVSSSTGTLNVHISAKDI